MNRTIEYKITEEQNGLRVEQFLRRKGYSGQNLAEIKRMPKSVLVNGKHYYMRQTLKPVMISLSRSAKLPVRKRSHRFIIHLILSMKMKISLL